MPELPALEAARRYAQEHAVGRTVRTVSFRPDGMDTGTSGSTLRDAFLGHRVVAGRRHGKHLFLGSGEERGRWLRLHFGMSGGIVALSGDDEEPAATRLRLDFEDDTSLAYHCRRKLGEIDLVADPDRWVEENGLGPDPLLGDFGLRGFREVLDGRTGTIKGALMNQEVLAGVGNTYSDEALFQAGIHPSTAVDALPADRVAELWRALKRILETATRRRVEGRDHPGRWLVPHREDGADCPRCDGTIRKETIAGRSSYSCDRHQAR